MHHCLRGMDASAIRNVTPIGQRDPQMDCYYASVHQRHKSVGINHYKFGHPSLQSAIVKIIYTKEIHELIFTGIFSLSCSFR